MSEAIDAGTWDWKYITVMQTQHEMKGLCLHKGT